MRRVVFPLVHLYLHHSRTLRIDPPLLGPEMPREALAEIEQFRERIVRSAGMEYLVSSTQKGIEADMQIDRRSWHFLMRTGGDIVGALRLVHYPFEASALAPGLQPLLEAHRGYLEIGRLMSGRRGAGVSRKLLIKAGLHCACHTHAIGFIALCKERNVPNFQRFGMSVVREGIVIPSRPGETYFLMSMTLETTARKVPREVIWPRIKSQLRASSSLLGRWIRGRKGVARSRQAAERPDPPGDA